MRDNIIIPLSFICCLFVICFRFLTKICLIIVWSERKPTRCNNQMFIINFCLNMFRASLCPSSGEQRPCVTSYGVLCWFCWIRTLWRLLSNSNLHSARILQSSAPQPLPTTSSRISAVHQMQYHTVVVLLKMGRMMPETCLDRSW